MDEQQGKTMWDAALAWVQQSAIRVIATRVIPLITGWTVLNVALVWLQNKIGIDLPPAAVATWLGAAVAGGVGKGIAFIKNLGEGQKDVLKGLVEAHVLYQSGRDALAAGAGGNQPPSVPPGITGGE